MTPGVDSVQFCRSSSFPPGLNHLIWPSDKASHPSSCRTLSFSPLSEGLCGHLDVSFNCLTGSRGQSAAAQPARQRRDPGFPPVSSFHQGACAPFRLSTLRQEERSPAACCVSPLAQVVSDDRLVEALPFVQELGDVLWGLLQEVVFQQELDSLRRRKQKPRKAVWVSPLTAHANLV